MIDKAPPREPTLISAVRNAGVQMVTVACSCGNTFTFHTDSDFVACPNCGTKGRWRASVELPPKGFEDIALMRSAKEKDHVEEARADDGAPIASNVDADPGRDDQAPV